LTAEQVAAHHDEHDGTGGDPDWLESVHARIGQHPAWRRVTLDPRRQLNLDEGTPSQAGVGEYAAMGTRPPAIVAVPHPEREGAYEIVDGMHRATAAARRGSKIEALVPAGGLRKAREDDRLRPGQRAAMRRERAR